MKTLNYIINLILSFINIIIPKLFIDHLAEIDFHNELLTNKELASSSESTKQKSKKSIREHTKTRSSLLRKKLLSSLILSLTAIGLAIIIIKYISENEFSIKSLNIYAIISISSFSIATLGKIGWEGQSYGGNTVFEKLDKFLLWFLYFIGILFGTLSIIN